MKYIFTKGSWVYHEFVPGYEETYCGNEVHTGKGFMPERSRLSDTPPEGLEMCSHCARLKLKPDTEVRIRRKRLFDEHSQTPENFPRAG